MTYDQLKDLPPTEFKRFTGVQRATFEKMVAALGDQAGHKKKCGRPAKLGGGRSGAHSLTVLAGISSVFHIAVSWQLSEAAVCRIVTESKIS